jgi:hypothetical protein
VPPLAPVEPVGPVPPVAPGGPVAPTVLPAETVAPIVSCPPFAALLVKMKSDAPLVKLPRKVTESTIVLPTRISTVA